MKKIFLYLMPALAFIFLIAECSKNKDENDNTTSTIVPDVYKKIYGATDIYAEGNYIVIKTKGLPDHKSPYYKTTEWESTKYEAYNGSNTSYFSNNAYIRQ